MYSTILGVNAFVPHCLKPFHDIFLMVLCEASRRCLACAAETFVRKIQNLKEQRKVLGGYSCRKLRLKRFREGSSTLEQENETISI